MTKFKTKKKIKKGLSVAMEILIEIEKILDKGLYLISYEKLKREVYYLEGDPRRL